MVSINILEKAHLMKYAQVCFDFCHCVIIMIIRGFKWYIEAFHQKRNDYDDNYILAGHAIVVVKDMNLLFYHGNAVILTLW